MRWTQRAAAGRLIVVCVEHIHLCTNINVEGYVDTVVVRFFFVRTTHILTVTFFGYFGYHYNIAHVFGIWSTKLYTSSAAAHIGRIDCILRGGFDMKYQLEFNIKTKGTNIFHYR